MRRQYSILPNDWKRQSPEVDAALCMGLDKYVRAGVYPMPRVGAVQQGRQPERAISSARPPITTSHTTQGLTGNPRNPRCASSSRSCLRLNHLSAK